MRVAVWPVDRWIVWCIRQVIWLPSYTWVAASVRVYRCRCVTCVGLRARARADAVDTLGQAARAQRHMCEDNNEGVQRPC